MGVPRNWAARLLRAVVRLAPEGSREWALAMLYELDFIEGEWAALFWALGSATAIFRHAARNWGAAFKNPKKRRGERMNATGKKAIGFLSGMVAAFLVVLCGFGVQYTVTHLFPATGHQFEKWTHMITMIILPETIFFTAAILLWRKRSAVAAGILLFAVTAGLHVIFWFATH
jgi:hypothetical protein